MKRKDFEEEDLYDDFSCISLSLPSRKSRRLDGELLQDMQMEPASEIPSVREQGLPILDQTTDGSAAHLTQMCNPVEERALVLYNPAASSLAKSPSMPEISIVVNTDLIPGLKDYFCEWENFAAVKAALGATEGKTTESDNCLAVVPWVPSQRPSATGFEELSGDLSEPMEAEGEVEMMETEDDNITIDSRESLEHSGLVGGIGGVQPWSQQRQQQNHCMAPNFFQNSMPVN